METRAWTSTMLASIPLLFLAGVSQSRGLAADTEPVAKPDRFEQRIVREPKYEKSLNRGN